MRPIVPATKESDVSLRPETLVDGRYRLLDRCGEGTFGEVWRAGDARLSDRPVAVKFLRGVYSDHEEAVARFLNEADALSRVQHPNVIAVSDRGRWGGRHYFVTEFVQGTTLAAWIQSFRAKGARPSLLEVAVLFDALCAGVEAAHAARIPGPVVHRDLKPANVLLHAGPTGELHVKVADFGIAQLGARQRTQTGALMGTIGYMAPEQATGSAGAVCAATDVFALGVILIELLTLKPQPGEQGPWWSFALHRPDSVDAILRALREDAPQSLAEVLRHALRGRPEERLSDAGALRTALRNVWPEGRPSWQPLRPDLPARASSPADEAPTVPLSRRAGVPATEPVRGEVAPPLPPELRRPARGAPPGQEAPTPPLRLMIPCWVLGFTLLGYSLVRLVFTASPSVLDALGMLYGLALILASILVSHARWLRTVVESLLVVGIMAGVAGVGATLMWLRVADVPAPFTISLLAICCGLVGVMQSAVRRG